MLNIFLFYPIYLRILFQFRKKNQRYTEYYGEENLFGIKEIQKKRPKFSRMT